MILILKIFSKLIETENGHFLIKLKDKTTPLTKLTSAMGTKSTEVINTDILV